MKSFLGFGKMVSLFISMLIVGRVSKRKILLVSTAFGMAGALAMVLAPSLEVACIGFFLLGLAYLCPTQLGVALISEFTEKTLSTKFTGSLIIGSTVAGMLVPLGYVLVPHWRYFSLYFVLIPAVLIFLCSWLILEDTPHELMKTKDAAEICRVLNRIGNINKGEPNLVTEEEVRDYLHRQSEVEQVKESASALDLFRYPSLRFQSVIILLLTLLLTLLFYGYGVTVNIYGFNPRLNQTLLGCC